MFRSILGRGGGFFKEDSIIYIFVKLMMRNHQGLSSLSNLICLHKLVYSCHRVMKQRCDLQAVFVFLHYLILTLLACSGS